MSRSHWIALAATIATAAALTGSVFFVINFTIIHDPHDVVEDAHLVWTGGSKPMSRLPWGSYVVYVKHDAGVQITCNNGTVTDGGYVTGMMADDYSVSRRCKIEP